MGEFIVKVVLSIAAAVVSLGAIVAATPASATGVSNNNHSVVKVKGCSNLASVVKNNHSVIYIDGEGNCDINQVMQDVSKNNHSVIKISNVCGDAKAAVAAKNNHSVVKIESNGACKTNVEVKKQETPAKAVSTAPKSEVKATEMPAELPETGLASVLSSVLGLGSVAYAGSAYIRSRK